MTWQVGYTITAGGESQDVILQIIADDQVDNARQEIATASRMEGRPNMRGFVRPPSTVWWVRPHRDE